MVRASSNPPMRSLLVPVLLVALAGTVPAAEPRLEPIFNGRDLTGWASKDMGKFWRVEDGVLIGENDARMSGNYLWSKQAYEDFVLEFDVRWTGEIDSGVEMRDPSIQLQLGVSRSLKRDMSGSFYVGKPGYPEAGQARTAGQLMLPSGQWNTFRLEARGPDFSVCINGLPASHYTDVKFTGAAPLGLQIHAGLKMRVEYRNLRLAVLERATPRPTIMLPALGEEVALSRIKEICDNYGLKDLWRKIERDPPVRPFKSDGCTGWFDDWNGVSLYPAGFLHDLKYWAGYPGEDLERLAADAELMLDVARLLGSTEMAETMFHGVRVGGSEKLKTPFTWGFGRKPLDPAVAKTP